MNIFDEGQGPLAELVAYVTEYKRLCQEAYGSAIQGKPAMQAAMALEAHEALRPELVDTMRFYACLELNAAGARLGSQVAIERNAFLGTYPHAAYMTWHDESNNLERTLLMSEALQAARKAYQEGPSKACSVCNEDVQARPHVDPQAENAHCFTQEERN